ncbi:MAG: MCE family protein [Nocardioides sp.]
MGLFPARNGPRKELRRIDLARRGMVTALVIALLLGLAYLRAGGVVGGTPEVSADVRNAGGALRSGADVKVAGVIVGRVTGIDRAPGGDVRISMTMPEDRLRTVPGNVVARILPATVFGTTFVDLVVHGSPSTSNLQAGAVIPADTEQGTLELQQALDDIDRLVNALGPAELASAIGSAAEALDGRGESIGAIIDVGERFLARLAPEFPLIRSDLAQLADNLEIVDELAPDLLDATDDALVTLETVVQRQASIAALITGGTTLVGQAEDLLDDNLRAALRTLDNGAILLDILYDNRRQGITEGIRSNIRLGKIFPTAIREGFLRADSTLSGDTPAFYGRADRPDYGPSGSLRAATFRGVVTAGGEE